jgi:hypothetical protein
MTTYEVRPATEDDVKPIIGLIDEAAQWLKETKGEKAAGQWLKPWPDEAARNARIRQGIQGGRTWMVLENDILAGSVTYGRQGNHMLWSEKELAQPAVYISRLVVNRKHSKNGIGASIIDWAGRRGMRAWRARWVRVDVWTLNHLLHDYYRNQGFRYLRTCPFKNEWDYPSAALFQKPTAKLKSSAEGRFTELPFQPTSADVPPADL